MIPARDAHRFLASLPIGKGWGIGTQTESFLLQSGMRTALEFTTRDLRWIEAHLTKPHQEVWYELRGIPLYAVDPKKKSKYQTISKRRTFTPPTSDKALVFSYLSQSVENACLKARKYNAAPKHVFAFLKTQDFRYHGMEIELSKPAALPEKILAAARPFFDRTFTSRALYRDTGVVLTHLEAAALQPDLFGECVEIERLERVHRSMDEIAAKYGTHTIFLGSNFLAHKHGLHKDARGALPYRQQHFLKGETKRRHLTD